nr:MAG TPA: hypothetical protein [Caudoviricetes sp.]
MLCEKQLGICGEKGKLALLNNFCIFSCNFIVSVVQCGRE